MIIKNLAKFIHPNDEHNLSEIKTIINELVRKYPAKGFHFDYFRYPGYQNHYSLKGRSNCLIKYGFDPENKLSSSGKDYRKFKNYYDEFLLEELTAALVDLRNFVKQINNELQVSIAVKPNYIIFKNIVCCSIG